MLLFFNNSVYVPTILLKHFLQKFIENIFFFCFQLSRFILQHNIKLVMNIYSVILNEFIKENSSSMKQNKNQSPFAKFPLNEANKFHKPIFTDQLKFSQCSSNEIPRASMSQQAEINRPNAAATHPLQNPDHYQKQ